MSWCGVAVVIMRELIFSQRDFCEMILHPAGIYAGCRSYIGRYKFIIGERVNEDCRAVG